MLFSQRESKRLVRIALVSFREDEPMRRWICAVAICSGLSSQAVAEEQLKAKFFARASCTVVRYYVAKYTVAAAESWARSKGATEAEIETARHCLKPQTAQGPS